MKKNNSKYERMCAWCTFGTLAVPVNKSGAEEDRMMRKIETQWSSKGSKMKEGGGGETGGDEAVVKVSNQSQGVNLCFNRIGTTFF